VGPAPCEPPQFASASKTPGVIFSSHIETSPTIIHRWGELDQLEDLRWLGKVREMLRSLVHDIATTHNTGRNGLEPSCPYVPPRSIQGRYHKTTQDCQFSRNVKKH